MMPTESNPIPSRYIVLTALSFDETGEMALLEAARVAQQTPCELHAVHVVSTDGAAHSGGELLSLEERLSVAPARMREYIEQSWKATPTKVFGHVRSGDPVASILQTAVDIEADLIVVGSHRRSVLQKLLLGSVVGQVQQIAHCPVLIAVQKDYAGLAKSEHIEAPCAECISARRTSPGTFWCERHSRHYAQPHHYEPSADRARMSLLPVAPAG